MKTGLRHLGFFDFLRPAALGSFLTIFAFLFAGSRTFANEVAPSAASPSVTYGLQAAATYQLLTGSPFSQTSNSGTGLVLNGERYFNDHFAAAINLAYRYHPGSSPDGQSMSEIGYGLLLKDYLGSEGVRARGTRFFFEYGLLLQIITQSGRPGSGTAHDTRLSFGSDFRAFGAPLFLTASYHFSTLRYFENPSVPMDYFGLEFGTLFLW